MAEITRRDFFPLAATLASLAGVSLVSGCSNTQATKSIDSARSFRIEEGNFTYGTDMSVVTDDYSLGSIQENNFGARVSFSYYDSDGTLMATAKQRLMSAKSIVDVYDAEGELLGTVSEEYTKNLKSKLTNLFSKKRYYQIKDAEGVVIAESEKVQNWGKTIKIESPSGDSLATFEQSGWDVGAADWKANFPGDIDRRLIIFIPSYQTRAENKRSE